MKPSIKKDPIPSAIRDTIDERIGALRVRLVDGENKLTEPTLLHSLLSSINRETEHVRRVSDGENGIPIVKVITKQSLIDMINAKEMLAKKKEISEPTKQVELNWAIDGNDLAYRLKRIEEFLRGGKRVEVMIAPKRKGRRAEREEIMVLIEKIKECVQGVEGASEWKPMEGQLGKVVEMYFKGTEQKQGRAELLEVRDEKLRKRDADKAERKLREEARLKRRQDRLEAEAREKERLGIKA